MTVDTDLWTEASRDLESEHAQLRLFEAQQRTADLWPFVALARSTEELGHRLALIQDTLTERVPDTSLHGALIEGLTANVVIQGYSSDAKDDDGDADDSGNSSSGQIDDSGSQSQDATPDITASRKPLQIWHEGKRQWLMVTADAPGNPAYFSGGPEEGPMTGETGTFPVEPGGPDPWNPINGKLPLPPTNVIEPANRFPAEPQPWSVPPDKGWIDHPMNFGTGPSAHATTATLRTHPGFGPGVVMHGTKVPLGATAVLHSAGTPQTSRDGFQPEQSNPFYFDQGQTGLASEESAGFPVDEALPEPNERVDLYQHAMPSGGGQGGSNPGEFAGPAINFTNPPQYVTSAKSNSGTCAADGCGRPVYRKGSKWHHLDDHLQGDHKVMLSTDHPWVQQMAHSSAQHISIRKVQGGYALFTVDGERRTKAMAYSAALKAKQANQYIKKDGDQWVITQKGTGKILSHHDSEEEAEKSFSAMEMNKHGRFVKLADGTDPTAAAGMSAPTTGGTPINTPAPPMPGSMTQGAPGAEAMPPMPQAGGGRSTANVPQSPTTAVRDPHVAALFHQAEDIRERPTQFNPTGAGDEFKANTWENQIKQSPRQSPEQRGMNTPQQPSEPIPQISSSDNPGENERSAQEDDDNDEG